MNPLQGGQTHRSPGFHRRVGWVGWQFAVGDWKATGSKEPELIASQTASTEARLGLPPSSHKSDTSGDEVKRLSGCNTRWGVFVWKCEATLLLFE
mmetsp:Transcript_22635/g.43969  ORF Transcript_22635/g.43969 Transcript_22635/m.43969 type:complete len:95 (+) Transcript_22635:2231-2515(+)